MVITQKDVEKIHGKIVAQTSSGAVDSGARCGASKETVGRNDGIFHGEVGNLSINNE